MDLVKKYPSDLANTFPDELEQFISYASSEGCFSVADMLKLLIREKLEGSFPDVHVALRILFVLSSHKLHWWTIIQQTEIDQKQASINDDRQPPQWFVTAERRDGGS